MKKVRLSLALLVTVLALTQRVNAQYSTSQRETAGRTVQTVPQVPQSIQFADLTIQLEDGARRIIQQDINALVQANRKYWEAKLDRIVLYFPLIERILQEEGIPTDFKFLAVQESSLTPDAVSASTAVGYWQFKKETATDHGLRVDDEVDERKSITASTHGAARYLKRSNAIYNNWMSSLFSYYLGTGGISKLVPPEWTFAKEITLNDRTDRYLLRFLAHKIAIESALPAYRTANTFALIEYPNGGGKSVAQVADELKVNEQEIRKYNRWVLGDNIPADKDYSLVIPADNTQIAQVRQKVQSAPAPVTPTQTADFATADLGFPVLRKVNYSKSKAGVVLYEINGLPGIQAVRGDNSTSLARKARISQSSFLRYNDMTERDPVKEGSVYYLAKKMKKAIVPFHNAREGETLRDISQIYGIRLKRLMRYNRISRAQRLQVGRVLWLRERRPANRPVEVIKMPPTQAPAPNRPIIAQADTESGRMNQPANRPSSGNAIPKNPSERKLYSPKLVESAPQPARSEPSVTPSAPIAAATPPPTTSPTPPPAAVYSSGSQDPTGNRRVIIIRPEGQSAGSDSQPTYSSSRPSSPTSTNAATPVYRSGGTSTSETASAPKPATGNSQLARATSPKADAPDDSVLEEPSPERPSPAPAATPSAVSTASRTKSTMHKVDPGQTYYSISRLYGVTIEELLEWNKLTLNDKLSVGQSILIKGAGEVAQNKPTSATGSSTSGSSVSEEIIYHTVQKGETMFRISRQYGVSVEQIQGWNQLADGSVKEGQRIKIIK